MIATSDAQPLGLWLGEGDPPERFPELRALAFSLSSRGDRVPGRLLLPAEGDGPFPVVMLQHGLGGSCRAGYLEATGGPWARRGVAVASIDFPLHGARADSKLSQRLLLATRGREHGGAPGELVRDLFRQAVVDLARTADALERMPRIDARRLAYAGFSMGSVIGVVFCAHDPRPRAVALAIGGAGLGPPGMDAPDFIARIAPRPLLMLNTDRDEIFPRERVQALFDAAGEPKDLRWYEGAHADVPGRALKDMWSFLSARLGV